MGLTASTHAAAPAEFVASRVTLYYASYGEDTAVWQAFADIERHEHVHVTLVDIARSPEAALADGVSEFPTLVCVNGAGRRSTYRTPDDLVSCYGRWVAKDNDARRAHPPHVPEPDALD